MYVRVERFSLQLQAKSTGFATEAFRGGVGIGRWVDERHEVVYFLLRVVLPELGFSVTQPARLSILSSGVRHLLVVRGPQKCLPRGSHTHMQNMLLGTSNHYFILLCLGAW